MNRQLPIFVLGLAGLAAPWVMAAATEEPTTQPTTKPSVRYEHAVIIPINDEMITDVTTESLRRRIDLARDDGVDLLVFELDTPGGMVSSALEICNLIRELTDIHTVAWVHNDAYSAGAMIAVSCDEIVISQTGHLGDCAPILVSPTGVEEMPKTERAKMESPIREIFRDAALQNDYDLLLSDAMVRLGLEIYWIENTETGERRFVDADEKTELLGDRGEKGLLSGLAGLGRTPSKWRLIESFEDVVTGKDLRLRQPVVEIDELLTLSAREAVAFGFARGIVSDQDELIERYNIGQVEVLPFNWSEKFTSWLTSWPVRGLLMVLLLLGAYVEFHTPGLGVAGAVALICLVILLGAPYMTGLATTWEITAVVLGLVLICVEVLFIPGFGVAGMLGLMLVAGGLLGTYVPTEPGQHFWPRMAGTWDALRVGVQTLLGAVIVALFGFWALARYLPRIPVAGGLILDGQFAWAQNARAGDPVAATAAVRVGARGVARTTLRPAGKAMIEGRRFDVVAEGDLIEQGSAVEVLVVEGNRVVVRAIDEPPSRTT